MIQQLRIYCVAADRRTARSEDYEIFERNKVAFHARFRGHAMRIMRKYGFEVLALWEAKTDRRTEFVYLLSWPDEASKEATWRGFLADYSPRPFVSLTR